MIRELENMSYRRGFDEPQGKISRENMVVLFNYSKDTCRKEESRWVDQRRGKVLKLWRRRSRADFGKASSTKGSGTRPGPQMSPSSPKSKTHISPISSQRHTPVFAIRRESGKRRLLPEQ